MLRSLIYRDWILNRRAYLMVLALVAAFQIYLVLRMNSSREWVVFTGVFMALQTLVPFTREEKFRSAGWTCTLPVRRREIVLARWVGAWLMVLAGLLFALAMGALLPGSRVDLAQAVAPDTLLLAAAVISAVLVLLMPFTIRYGLMGVMIFLVAAQILGTVLLLALTMTGGRAGGSGDPLRAIYAAVRDGLAAWQGRLTPPAFHLAVLAALALVNWIGYRAALALYRRREF